MVAGYTVNFFCRVGSCLMMSAPSSALSQVGYTIYMSDIISNMYGHCLNICYRI